MKHHMPKALSIAALAVSLAACASQPKAAAAPDSRDVLIAAPEHYRVLVENAHVRIVECTLGPGEKDRMHTHPAGWFRVTRAGTMRVHFATGKESVWHAAQDESGWAEAEAAHTSENIGDAPMSFILVEVKSAA